MRSPLLILIGLHAACLLPRCSSPAPSAANDTPPNIIFILADDLGYGELGCYGQTKIETPNLDALAAGGMLFTQHYSGAPVCAPARSVLLTGRHLGRNPVRGNDEWAARGAVWDYRAVLADPGLEGQTPLPAGTRLLPAYLQDAGYRTGMIGKWGLGAPTSHSVPTKMGFDYFFGYNCQRQAHTLTPNHLWENGERVSLPNDTVPPGTGLPPGVDPYDPASYAAYNQPAYAPSVSFNRLMSFVDQEHDRPFFLYWATPVSHVPLQAPQDWVDHYHEKFGEEEPYFFRAGERGSYFPVRYPRATYAAMVSYLDENIGALVGHLKSTGQYDNTLIVFTSDNGPTYTGGTDSPWFDSGGPFAAEYGRGKGFLYEGGIRVPMIAHWPAGIAAGGRSDHVSGFQDFLPTLCELAAAETPVKVDGLSLLPTLTGKGEQRAHEYLYWEFPEYGGQVAVRAGDWKMIWPEIKKGNTAVEVYNLADDPGEEVDLAERYPDKVAWFREVIRREHTTPANERFRLDGLEQVYNDRKQ